MKDVVMILAHVRTEFLYLNLKNIATNPDFKDYFYLFVLDYGFRPNLPKVIIEWAKKHKVAYEIFKVPSAVKGIGKQSYAVLEGYRKAQSLAKEFVFMLEEDIMVSNQFFQWHKTIQAKEDLFCSIATRSHNHTVAPTVPQDYYTISKYQSLGNCFRKKNLSLVLRHANGVYYMNPFSYVQRIFPNSSIGGGFCEQDGLFFRVIEKNKLKVAYSTVGFAQHSGIYGYNRKINITTGTLPQKVQKLEGIIYNKERTKHYILRNGGTPHNVSECIPTNLNPQWNGELNKIEV